MNNVKTGLDRLADNTCTIDLKGKDVGLISNQTGVSKDLRSGYEVLRSSGASVKYLFGPEHGFTGDLREGGVVGDTEDEGSNTPIIGLYKDGFDPPRKSTIAELDTLIYDIQDLAVRCYTYVYTMIEMMDIAAEAGTEFLIFDRPPPLSGKKYDGSVIKGELSSFIGGYGLPMIYGLTPGELGKYVSSEYEFDIDPQVVRMEGWSRHLWYDETDLLWVAPSPGIPHFETALIYPATVLFEATNVSEGRGTTKPFQYFGAPWIRSAELTDRVEELKEGGLIKGFDLRRCSFIPRFSKYEGEQCHGCEIFVRNRDQFSPFRLGLSLLKLLRDLYPGEFEWYNGDLDRDISYFDRLAGSVKYRELIDEGSSFDRLLEYSSKGLREFSSTVEDYFLYT